MPKHTIFLPAEWHKQSAVQLTWPHAATDWKPILKDVIRCYLDMAKAISEHEELIIVTPEPEHVQGQLERALPAERKREDDPGLSCFPDAVCDGETAGVPSGTEEIPIGLSIQEQGREPGSD